MARLPRDGRAGEPHRIPRPSFNANPDPDPDPNPNPNGFRGTGAQGATGGAGKREVGRFKARVRVVEADLKSRALPRLDLADLFEQVPVHRMLEHAWHARA